jgi:hypothetical protein
MSMARVALAGALAALASVPSALAGQKLYDMSIFFRPDRGAPATSAPTSAQLPGRSTAQRQPRPPPAWTDAPLPSRTVAAPSSPRDAPGSGIASVVSELVVGFWRHDPEQDNNESDTLDINAEIIFREVDLFGFENRYLDFFFTPRPLIGGSLNNKNKTHTAYAELNWRHIFGNQVFIAASWGLAYHTGNLERPTRQCVHPKSAISPATAPSTTQGGRSRWARASCSARASPWATGSIAAIRSRSTAPMFRTAGWPATTTA